MSQGKQIIWLQLDASDRHLRKVRALEMAGREVTIASSLSNFREKLQQRKYPIILLGDGGDDKKVRESIIGIRALPEIWGARFILIVEKYDADLLELAASLNFRDLIPLNLPEDEWVFRIGYSSAGRERPFPLPTGQITLKSIAKLDLPARLIWMSPTRMCIETEIFPAVGSRLAVVGNLARELRVPHILFVVEGVKHEQLKYRFSTAVVGRWRVEPAFQAHIEAVLKGLRNKAPSAGHRVYIAMKDKVRKHFLADYFEGQLGAEVSIALFVKSIGYEPKFFTPDIIFMDADLCVENGYFSQMLAVVSKELPIIIVDDGIHAEKIRRVGPEHHLIFMSELTTEVLDALAGEYLSEPSVKKALDEDAFYFEKSSDESFAMVSCPARLSKIHPFAVEVSCPYKVKRFALAHLKSPLLQKILGRDLWIKVTGTRPAVSPDDPSFPERLEGILADIEIPKREALGQALGDWIHKHLTSYQFDPHKTESSVFEQEIEEASHHAALEELLKAQAGEEGKELEIRPVGEAGPKLVPPFIAPVPSSEEEEQEPIPIRRPIPQPFSERLVAALTSDSFKKFLIFLVISLGLLILLTLTIPYLAQHYEKSGGVYSEQLERFKEIEREKREKGNQTP
ncbi:MAG: hypothetical protein HYW48_11390 [Deltaproteobacteria bacterium]|nr:hypothetical protein [Deltaproteobacteria bacterium]